MKLPIEKTIEKLEIVEKIYDTPVAQRTVEQIREESQCRRECRDNLELSTKQLEDMQEKKGEFGNEYRVVTAAWYMMMLPDTTLDSHLMAPHDASKVAWEFQEREFERRRLEGEKYRTAREDETLFDEEAAKRHPYELTQTRRRHDITVSIPVPAKTKASDVRILVKETSLHVTILTHPLNPVIDGKLFRGPPVDAGGEWHLEANSSRVASCLTSTKKS